jgi:3-phenylpropionate/trans-cinnamate dioxygenase ferredoxin subunit
MSNMSEPRFIAVAKLADLSPSQALKVECEGQAIVLCNSQDRIFAVSATCTHAFESLECGRVRNGWIACPAHGARFSLETGAALNPPAKDPLRVYPVRVEGDTILVAI